MRVLLTGASGLLGRYVLNGLQRRGIDTVTLGRRSLPDSGSTSWIEADLLQDVDFSALVQKARATHLLHLAWYAEHGRYWNSPLNLRWVEATTRLTEAFCLAGGRQIVVAGTCAEYDWTYGYCREDVTPLNPATLYGVAKDAARRLTMAVCREHGIPCAWGRVFLPFGAGEVYQRLIPSLIEVFLGQRPPFGVNAMAYRDFLHASDVAEGFVRLLTTGVSGAYNICSGEPMRLAEVVTNLASLLGANPESVLALSPDRAGEPPLFVGENLKLKTLGWQPSLTLRQGLEYTFQGWEL